MTDTMRQATESFVLTKKTKPRGRLKVPNQNQKEIKTMEKEIQLLLDNNFTVEEARETLETAHVIYRVSSDPRRDIGRFYTEIVPLEEYQEAYEQAEGDDVIALWERIGTEVLHNNPFIYVNDDIIINTF